MRKNTPMTSKSLLLTMIASSLILTGALAGCGSDDDSAPDTSTPPSSAPAQSTGAGSKDEGKKVNGPASAGDEKKDAPDNKISDRPGGPNDQGNGKEKKGSTGSHIEGPPVNPDPSK